MTGTFEIVFAGLCFLLLGGTADGPEGGYEYLQVNLPQTCHPDEDCPSRCRPAYTECEDITLYPHAPRLVIPTGQWEEIACSAKKDGRCDFERMGCEEYKLVNGEPEWWCDLNGRELCVRINDHPATPSYLDLAEGRDGRENRPDDDREAVAFDWLPHLARIDGYHIARLKQEVYGPVGPRKLIASRIHASRGELSTLSLGVPRGENKAWSWKVEPDRQPGWPWQEDHPKVVAEAMLLRIEAVNSIRLESCGADDSNYSWKFTARDGPFRIRVQHFASGDHSWTVDTHTHPHRIRDFLWYYNLVEWMDGQCPDYLSAPVCPQGNCEKEWPGYLPEPSEYRYRPEDLRNANHFCQPTTYP